MYYFLFFIELKTFIEKMQSAYVRAVSYFSLSILSISSNLRPMFKFKYIL